VLCCAVLCHSNVLEDADKLHAEGLVYKLYNGEFKVDVFFAVPQQRYHLAPDLLDTYLKTDVSHCDQSAAKCGLTVPLLLAVLLAVPSSVNSCLHSARVIPLCHDSLRAQ
jgi:hypothetical protein